MGDRLKYIILVMILIQMPCSGCRIRSNALQDAKLIKNKNPKSSQTVTKKHSLDFTCKVTLTYYRFTAPKTGFLALFSDEAEEHTHLSLSFTKVRSTPLPLPRNIRAAKLLTKGAYQDPLYLSIDPLDEKLLRDQQPESIELTGYIKGPAAVEDKEVAAERKQEWVEWLGFKSDHLNKEACNTIEEELTNAREGLKLKHCEVYELPEGQSLETLKAVDIEILFKVSS